MTRSTIFKHFNNDNNNNNNNNNNKANIYTGQPISSNKKNCYQKGPVIIS